MAICHLFSLCSSRVDEVTAASGFIPTDIEIVAGRSVGGRYLFGLESRLSCRGSPLVGPVQFNLCMSFYILLMTVAASFSPAGDLQRLLPTPWHFRLVLVQGERFPVSA